MSRVKRPSVVLDPAIVSRAVELRKAGRTMREIAAEVGASRAALGGHFQKSPELAGAAVAAVVDAAEDAETRQALGATARRSRKILDELLATARSANGRLKKKIEAGDELVRADVEAVGGLVREVGRVLETVAKLERGRGPAPIGGGGARGPQVQVNVLGPGALDDHTPAERSALEAARRARGSGPSDQAREAPREDH